MYKHLSLDSLKNLEIIDPDLITQMMNIFLSEFPEQIKNIQRLADEKNGPEFGRRIHALKGSVSVFGCADLCTAMKIIELLAKDSKIDESLLIYKAHRSKIDEFVSEIRHFLAAEKHKSNVA